MPRTCLYDILQVPSTATQPELKKAYRKRALEEHPDKNMHRVQESTLLFADIQQAYETLSDPHERAWYDAHRESILADNESDESLASHSGKGRGVYSGLDAGKLMRFFMARCWRGFADDDAGFFAVYRRVFEQIEREERDLMTESDVDEHETTSFGSSFDTYTSRIQTSYSTPYTLPQFYSKFLQFTTRKTFAHLDMYRLSDATDRRTRRLMEKDNKRLRDTGKREYNEAVRSLCAFVRKRDGRYCRWLEDARKEREERDEANAKRERDEKKARAERSDGFVEQDWTRLSNEMVEAPYSESDVGRLDLLFLLTKDVSEESDGEDSTSLEEDNLFCYACEVAFKSIPQHENHAKSKKHIVRVALLKQMMQDDDFDEIEDISEASKECAEDEHTDSEIERQIIESTLKVSRKKNRTATVIHLESDPSDAEIAIDKLTLSDTEPSMKTTKKSRRAKKQSTLNEFLVTPQSIVEQAYIPATKLDSSSSKQKPKKHATTEEDFVCNVCSIEFRTRNKLFDHIKASKHAQASSTPPKHRKR